MLRETASPGTRLLRLSARLDPLPGGRWLFSRILGHIVPYSGGLRAVVDTLEPGWARVRLRERRAVRNHLGSVHAVALANLGELATGLAVLTALPEGVRGIVLKLEVAFVKKARGTLVAEARWAPPAPLELPCETIAEAGIRDAEGDTVARVAATWRLGAVP